MIATLNIAIDDEGREVNLDPENDRFWQCHYCSYRNHCLADGPGEAKFK